MLIMTNNQFERLSALSEKIMLLTATVHEMKEFNQLLDFWNTSVEINLINASLSK
jgi:hypothetical protein